MNKLTGGYTEKIFKEYLKSNGYRENTIRTKTACLKVFLDYVRMKGIEDMRDITAKDILSYLEYLNELRTKRKGRLLLRSTKQGLYTTVRLLFRCLYLNEVILTNPTQDISIRNYDRSKPKQIFSKEAMGEILNKIDNPRDRAIYELVYSSGLRVSEVSNLKIEDIDFENRLLHIRQAKFNQDKIVPVSNVAIRFLEYYLAGRKEKKEEPAFLGSKGGLRKNTITRIFRKYLKAFKVYKEGLSVHSIRHSISTHLLEAGANLRYVQELLGHRSIETTVKYTHALYENLKRVYKSHHPRENEYYEEIDEGYMERLRKFKEELMKQREINDKKREIKRRSYLRKKLNKT